MSVGSLCDNVEVDPETGDLWMGCHPNAMKLLMADPKDPAGSEVSPFPFFILSLYRVCSVLSANVHLDFSYLVSLPDMFHLSFFI